MGCGKGEGGQNSSISLHEKCLSFFVSVGMAPKPPITPTASDYFFYN